MAGSSYDNGMQWGLGQRMLSRRSVLQLLSGAAAATAISACAEVSSSSSISAADDAFLDDMQRRAALYFWEQADAASGQVLDRAYALNTDGKLRALG